MVVAVIGAGGFVGSHLIPALHKRSLDVRQLTHSHSSLAGTFPVDVLSGEGLDNGLVGVDVLVNLVGYFPEPVSQQIDINVKGVIQICEAAVRANVKKVIHISASAAYGDSDGKLFAESDPLTPNTTYGLSKKLGEEVVLYYAHKNRLPYVIVRPTNIYGPGTANGVIASYTDSFYRQNKIQITGDGNQLRDFIYVTDFVDAMMRIIIGDVVNEIYNVSYGNAVTLNTLKRVFDTCVGYVIPVEYVPAVTGHVHSLSAGNSKIRTSLGWAPSVSIEQGVQDVLRSYATVDQHEIK